MLRTSTARLLASAARRPVPAALPRRALTTTRPALIRIKKPEGAAPPDPHPSKPSKPESAQPNESAPSMGEKPAAVPEDIAPPPPFEPKVSRPAETFSDPASSGSDPAEQPPVAPSEPPAPEKPAAAEEAIPETPDLSKLPSLDIDPEASARAAAAIEQPKEDAAKGKKKGRKQRPEYVSSQDERRRNMVRLGYASLIIGGITAFIYVGTQDKEGEAKDDRPFFERLKGNVTEMSDVFSKPAFKKLLPDPLPPNIQRPYTLLIELEDLLVHSSWDRQHGWRTAKRPGVDYFLSYLSQFYEIVLFTTQPNYTALPVAEKLDPMTFYIPYKLFRDVTRAVDGKIVKDLAYLNRDLGKVVMLDTNPDSAYLQPENAIILKPWNGKPRDTGLVDMIPFLESIAFYAPADVRPVLKHYAGKDIPTEYAKVEAAAKEAAIKDWEARNPVGGGGSWLSGLVGGSSSSRPKQPMSYLEIKRAQAQAAYQEEQKYLRDHHDELVKMMAEDRERADAEAKASIMSMFGKGPAPDAAKQEQAKA